MANQNTNPGGFKKLTDSVGNLLGAAGTVASTGAKLTGGTARGSAGIAGRVASGSAGLLGGVINTVANTARRYPKISFAVAIYAAFKGVQGILRRNKENKETLAQNGIEPMAQTQSYDPRAYDQAQGMPGQFSPEQEALLREMQQQAATQPVAPAQQHAAQGKWADQISRERQQAAQQSGQTR